MPPAPTSMEDPFLSKSPTAAQTSHAVRHGAFDLDAFALQSNGSPKQARLAVEAHLKETDRRIQDASKLGTSLVQQRKELAARLKELHEQKDEDEIGPDLRRKLADLERDYADIGRESARAFLPKSRLASGEHHDPTLSPAVFSGISGPSPSKVAVPNRKQRNQPSSRVHDIEFATEISTSLLAQVRSLQAALSEKDEALKRETSERARFESEIDNVRSRLRYHDDNEQRYKDENWNLETQVQELTSAVKAASDKEQRSNVALRSVHTEKDGFLRELEDLRQAHGRLADDHAALKRSQEGDLHLLRRDITGYEHERDELHRKMDELNSKNADLARALGRMHQGANPNNDIADSDGEVTMNDVHDENSPPPSPSKRATGGMLETETLRSSIAHAHRMIQTLKNNIHREKTEKLELKRLLQDARDELESKRVDKSGTLKKRRSETEATKTRKLRADQLGSHRASREEITNDPDWEDEEEDANFVGPTKNRHGRLFIPGAYGTASEESTDAFETANERDTSTETEAFQTGNEAFEGESSGEATETEAGPSNFPNGSKRPSTLTMKRMSYMSTASTSADESDRLSTPISLQPKYKVKNLKSRGSFREGNIAIHNESPALTTFRDSPAYSTVSSNKSTPHKAQNLGDELDALSGDESIDSITPSRNGEDGAPDSATSPLYGGKRQTVQPIPTPSILAPRVPMVDSGMMTEPWVPAAKYTSDDDDRPQGILAVTAGALGGLVTGGLLGRKAADRDDTISTGTREADDDGARLHGIHTAHTLSSITASYTVPVSPQADVSRSAGSLLTDNAGRLSSAREDIAVAKPALMPTHSFTDISSQHTPPVVVIPSHTFGSIVSQDMTPIATSHDFVPEPVMTSKEDESQSYSISPVKSQSFEPISAEGSNYFPSIAKGTAANAAAIPVLLHPDTPTRARVVSATEKEVFATPDPVDGERNSFAELDRNAAPQLAAVVKPPVPTVEHGSQTLVSSKEIDSLMRNKNVAVDSTGVAFVTPQTHDNPPAGTTSVRRPSESLVRPVDSAAVRRPGSAGSLRNKSHTPPPPLPNDHTERIAQAATRNGTMGPPLMPASAYRINQQPVSRSRTSSTATVQKAPSLRVATSGTMRSPISRHSSLSSFASEVDNRLNPAGNFTYPAELPPSTDPRMIAAITQTMIGEYLWKYTRSTLSSSSISSNRHRRFFWVHPYTRTLYWSDSDPSAAGKTQLKAKSVAIQDVRVMSDDNTSPPGLHSKSLVVVTPGRELVFTAPTGGRHETWFNALSYLLLRTGGPEGANDANANAAVTGGAQGDALTEEDLAEFNPSYRSRGAGLGINQRGTANSSRRTHMGTGTLGQVRTTGDSNSVGGNTQHNTSAAHNNSFTYMDHPTLSPGPQTRTPSSLGHRSPSRSTVGRGTIGPTSPMSGKIRSGSVSGRIGSFFSSRGRGSVSSHVSTTAASGPTGANGVDEVTTTGVSDLRQSMDDVRRQIEDAERLDRLENVRACCDGKHDVGSLSTRSDGIGSGSMSSAHSTRRGRGTESSGPAVSASLGSRV